MNDEARMSKDEGMTKPERGSTFGRPGFFRHSDFVIFPW